MSSNEFGIELHEENLHIAAGDAGAIREMCQTRGWAILTSEIDKKIHNLNKQWLKEKDPSKAETLRQEAKVWNTIDDILKRRLLVADAAKLALEQISESQES